MDLAARKRFIISTVWLTIPAPFVVGIIAYRTIPAPSNMGDPAARLALAAKWLVVAMLPYAFSCLSIACVFFALARAIYWWGYARQDTLGRAPGVQLTFSLNVQMLLAALYFLAR